MIFGTEAVMGLNFGGPAVLGLAAR
jgi:hypothetical protein